MIWMKSLSLLQYSWFELVGNYICYKLWHEALTRGWLPLTICVSFVGYVIITPFCLISRVTFMPPPCQNWTSFPLWFVTMILTLSTWNHTLRFIKNYERGQHSQFQRYLFSQTPTPSLIPRPPLFPNFQIEWTDRWCLEGGSSVQLSRFQYRAAAVEEKPNRQYYANLCHGLSVSHG